MSLKLTFYQINSVKFLLTIMWSFQTIALWFMIRCQAFLVLILTVRTSYSKLTELHSWLISHYTCKQNCFHCGATVFFHMQLIPFRRVRFQKSGSTRLWYHCWKRCQLVVQETIELWASHHFPVFEKTLKDHITCHLLRISTIPRSQHVVVYGHFVKSNILKGWLLDWDDG